MWPLLCTVGNFARGGLSLDGLDPPLALNTPRPSRDPRLACHSQAIRGCRAIRGWPGSLVGPKHLLLLWVGWRPMDLYTVFARYKMQSVVVTLVLFRVGIELMALGRVGPWELHCNILYYMAKRANDNNLISYSRQRFTVCRACCSDNYVSFSKKVKGIYSGSGISRGLSPRATRFGAALTYAWPRVHEQKTKSQGRFSAGYTAKRCVIKHNLPANLHGGGALHGYIQSPQSYAVPCRYAGTMPSELGLLLPL